MWLELFKFELLYRVKRPDTYLYFLIVLFCGLGAIDFIYSEMMGSMKENAPYVIAFSMGVTSSMLIIIASMIMGVSILRDFQYRMESFLFVTPISKIDYLTGRFLGSFVILLFIFSGLLLGIMMSPYLPWRDATNQLEFDFWTYLRSFIIMVIPNLFFAGSLFFVTGALSRKLVIVYTQGILLLVAYIAIMILFSNGDDRHLLALFDPFGFNTINYIIEKWSVAQRNVTMIPVNGVLLYNRLIWICAGIISLVTGYFGFSFNVVRTRLYRKKGTEDDLVSSRVRIDIPSVNPSKSGLAAVIQFLHHVLFYFRSITREVPFIAIILSGIAIIMLNGISLNTSYGVSSLPKSYLIVEELTEMSVYFFLIIMIMYSGELVWKERDVRMNLVYDATPSSDLVNLMAKYLGLLLNYIVLLFILMLSGIMVQTLSGYHDYSISTYLYGFFIELFPFLALFTLMAFVIQVLVNHKFMGHLIMILFIIGTTVMEILGISHDLIRFGGDTLGKYSEMNGYAGVMGPYLLIKTYWWAVGLCLFGIAILFSVRGTETALKNRFKLVRDRLGTGFVTFLTIVSLTGIGTGSWIFYNTNILNDYVPQSDQLETQAQYEKTLKKFEYLTQPKIVDTKLEFDLYPESQDYDLKGTYLLVNKSDTPIPAIHVQELPIDHIDLVEVQFNRENRISEQYENFGYTIYDLKNPLLPGDSIEMNFHQTFTTEGFTEENPRQAILQNGTFIVNDYFPSLGYRRNIELSSEKDRKAKGLPIRMDRAEIDDPRELRNARTGDDGYEINFEAIISTSPNQRAVAPGRLIDQWSENGRNYFHYKMDKPMINFYAIVSAEYKVATDKWAGDEQNVSLEIYHHEGHEYNLDRMTRSMKASLDYFSKSFGPYPYDHLRIMEFPRYRSYAMSLPSTIPYSEDLGFIMDIDDEKDVDMVFFVTAHEISHQWWGLQLVAANVQGRHMLLESLAQYSAVMLLRKHFPEEKVQQLLKGELDSYLRGRAVERKGEKPLALTTGQRYIHYRKGAFNMFTFQDYVSEDSVNMALKRFVDDWNCFDGPLQKDRYATTQDLMKYFREVTPDSLQYIVEDLFETITLYDLEIVNSSFTELSTDRYEVILDIETKKFKSDSLGNETEVTIRDWVDIGVYSEDDEGGEKLIYLQKHLVDQSSSKITLEVSQKPVRVAIDPKSRLVEKETKNNFLTLY